MKRNLTIVIEPTNNPEQVHINNLQSIVNYSCDTIIMSYLEYLLEKDHHTILKILLEKLRPSGRLILQISNIKSITENWLKQSISSQEFLNSISNKQSILSLDNIYTYIDFKVFDITNIITDQNSISIEIERKTL